MILVEFENYAISDDFLSSCNEFCELKRMFHVKPFLIPIPAPTEP